MRVILTMNNQPADLEAGYALRLIEQGRAIALRKQADEDEKKVEEILAERTEFKAQDTTPILPSENSVKEVTAEEWVEGKATEEGNKKQRGKKPPKKAGEGNVAG